LYKEPNIAGIDPETGAIIRLFHPRTDVWDEHFRWEQSVLQGIAPIGRARAMVLAINEPTRVALRQMLAALGKTM
jgi:hypothetical protein